MKNLSKCGQIILFMLSIVSTSWAQCFITVTSPQAGTTLGCGNNIVTWTSQYTSGYVKIEYYCDGSWTTIISGTPDDGSYGWYINSGICCETARLRVTDLYGNCSDTSDEFSIDCECQECQINITAPKGGENLDCGPYKITWTSQSTSGAVKIRYRCDGNWNLITSNTPDDGSYTWTIPAGTCCQNSKIRIIDINDSNCYDQTNSFNINCECECLINITSPDAGDTIGCDHTITWTTQNTSGNVNIEYFCDGDWIPIVLNTPDDGSYNWGQIDGCCDSTFIKISDALDSLCFSINGPFVFDCNCCEIDITSPNGGEIIYCSLSENDIWAWDKITWTSKNTSGLVKIEYFCDSLWHVITPATPDDGEYSWGVFPDLLTDSTCCDTAFIKISDVQNPLCYDLSDSAFTINCGCDSNCEIEITYPNGGEIIYCSLSENDIWAWDKIKWTSKNTSGLVKIEYFCDSLWHVITPATPDDGEYPWGVFPDFITDSTCCDTAFIKITDVQNPLCYDISDSAFTINCGCDSDCDIEITYPNGGEIIYCSLSESDTWAWEKIQWTSTNTSGLVKIEYFCDSLWHVITPATPDVGEYPWGVFSDLLTDSTCCDTALIKITDVQNPLCYDYSDSAFTISCGCDSNCAIDILSPATGVTISCNHTITWTSQNTSGNVNIEYNCDGDWHPIVFNTPDNGSYPWTDFYPPGGCCDNMLIRVSDALDPQCYDVNGPFNFNCECDDWFFKKSDGDSIKYGVPDFDQKQDSWQAWRMESIFANVWTHCGPVAVANCLWWYDSRIEADYNHKVDLVKSYGSWDDKNINNVKPFVKDLARRCRTNMPYPSSIDQPRLGTDIYDMQVGINSLLYDSDLDTFLFVHKEQIPSWDSVSTKLVRCQDVILLLGIYGINENTQQWERIGGHYVTMAGFNDANPPWIGISDPFLDHAEGDQGIGNPPHDAYVHNNSNRISGPHGTDNHDPYMVDLVTCTTYAEWKLPTYKISQQMFYNFLHQNDYRPTMYIIPTYSDSLPPDSICVNSEYALYVSLYEENLGSIGGIKTDNSGNFIEGWKIKLFDSNGNLLDVTFTDINGRFLFGGLTPAIYTISEEKISGWQSVSPLGGKYTVNLNPNEHIRDLEFINLDSGTDIDEKSNKQLYEFRLERNYPNPFNPTTTIEFGISKPCHVDLSIYNLSGQIVDKLVSQYLTPGSYRYTWDAVSYTSGIYFYKIVAGESVEIKKMIFMK